MEKKEKDNKLSDTTNETIPDKNIEKKKPPVKPPKIEEKPFQVFIEEHLIPSIKAGIQINGVEVSKIEFMKGERPVVGGDCWFIYQCPNYIPKT